VADTSRTVEIIFQGNNQLGGAIGSVESSLGGLSGDADDAASSVDRLGQEVDQLGGTGSENINKLALALKALAASAVVKEFTDANVAVESFKRGIGALTGDTDAAAREFEYLADTSDRLGLNLQAVSTSYLSLSAATRGTALEGEETRRIFEAVSTAMGLLGKSTADADGALLAISQIVSKGVVSMEELRQQLGERLPGAFQIAAKSMGLTTQELNDLVATGTLTAEEFLPKFARGIEEAFGNPDRVDTFVAAFNRLKNAVTEAALVVGDGGGFQVLTKVVETATASLLGAVGTAEIFVTSLGLLKQAITSGISPNDFFGGLDAAIQQAADRVRGARDDLFDFGTEGQTASDGLEEIVVQAKRITPNVLQFKEAMNEAAAEVSKTAVELEKIASNERIANIDARVTLDVAGIEADAAKAVASIENIGAAITSTGELLGSLFDNRLDADSWEERRLIEESIRKEQENRESQLKKNNKLIDEQIKKLRAQTDALRRGDALITIDGAGLQPHLEAFMFEILDALQVRVNAEGGDLLLGALS
jgi:tape measure domain-containing protein